MRRLLHPKEHKSILVSFLALASFAGFEALALALRYYQIGVFWQLAAYLYLFLLLWVGFSYHTHRRHALTPAARRSSGHYHELLNYLILPTVIFWATAALLYLDPFARGLQFFWTLLGASGLGAGLWYLKTVFRGHKKSTANQRGVAYLAKLLASYLAAAAAFGIGHHMGYGGAWTAFLIFLTSMLLMRQALFQHHEINSHTITLTFAASGIVALAGYYIYGLWSVNFYTAALALSALYNTIWGFVHHEYIARDLTRKIAYEYLAVLFVIYVFLLSTTNFAERI